MVEWYVPVSLSLTVEGKGDPDWQEATEGLRPIELGTRDGT